MAEEIKTAEIESPELESADADPTPSTAEVSSDELAKNPEIQAAFARVFGGKGEIDETDEEGDEPAPEVAEEADQTAEPDEGSKPQPKPAAKPPVKAKGTVPAAPAEEAQATLAPALQQAAKRAGWNEADINEFHAANPELAEKTFANLQTSHNELSRRFAQLGQMRGPQMQQPAVQPVQQAQQPAQLAALEAAYKNLPEFAANNGEQLAKVVKDLYEGVVQPFKQMQAAYEAQSRQAMSHQVNATFGTFADFADLYGQSGKLTQEQHQTRYEVAVLADRIRSGASLQGIDLSVNDALEQAHNLFTADRVKQTTRREIQQQVVTRGRQITNRPTQRRTPQTAAEGARRTEAGAMKAVANWWAERGVDA